jgi:hypothetical protein
LGNRLLSMGPSYGGAPMLDVGARLVESGADRAQIAEVVDQKDAGLRRLYDEPSDMYGAAAGETLAKPMRWSSSGGVGRARRGCLVNP